MELTTLLESEKHANRDVAQKLSDTNIELLETKQLVCFWKCVCFSQLYLVII